MRVRLLLFTITVFLMSASLASAHLIKVAKSPTKSKLENRETSQRVNLAHARYVARHGHGRNARWHRLAVRWLTEELLETRRLLRPPLSWRQTVTAWIPTLRCETGGTMNWYTNTGNGYFGGLQFDSGTWKSNGGRTFALQANLATPAQQALVASRLTYDGWPNCPNP